MRLNPEAGGSGHGTASRRFLVAGALFAALGVTAGAFAAHGLKSRLTPELLAVFETAVRYQTIHALALLAVGLAARDLGGRLLRAAGLLFVVGIVIFSGSLYALSLSGQRWLGAITPLGGLAFIAGWGCFALAAWRRPD